MDKKQQLLDYENYLLKEIENYEKRLVEELKNETSKTIYNESDCSDLEFELNINNESSLLELKLEKKQLKTCYLATSELTDVTIVQSEMNILPDDPEYDGGPISEPGVWKEIIAECRIGMVPFSISFVSHQASRLFAPISFRNLQVLPIKKPQEIELYKSVLPRLTRPSDVIQLLRSYESAYRSRRATLASLSDRYGDVVGLQAKADGGYVIKCDGILNMSWLLQNKNSHLSRFHHKMSFDLEYIDGSYIKIIRKANKKLENQSIQTDERTQLLASIIDACLEAKAALENQSGSENERVHQTSQNEDHIMAPPKTIPKKTKKDAPKPVLVNSNHKTGKTAETNAPQRKNAESNKTQTHDTTDTVELLNSENVDKNRLQGENVTVNTGSEKVKQNSDKTKTANVEIIENRIIKTGNNNIEKKKRKIDVTEKLSHKKMKTVDNKKQSVSTNEKSNTVKDKVTSNNIRTTNELKSMEKQSNIKPVGGSNAKPNNNKIIKNNDAKKNAENERHATRSEPKINKVSKVQSTAKQNTLNTQNNKTDNAQKITDKRKDEKPSQKTNFNIGKEHNKTENQRNIDTHRSNEINSGNPNTRKENSNTGGNTPTTGQKRKSLGSGGKTKIPIKKPDSKNQFLQTGKKLPTFAKKSTNIPISKRP